MMMGFVLFASLVQGPQSLGPQVAAKDFVMREVAYTTRNAEDQMVPQVRLIKPGSSYVSELNRLKRRSEVSNIRALNPRLGGFTQQQLQGDGADQLRSALQSAWAEFESLSPELRAPISERSKQQKRKTLGYLESYAEWVSVRAWPTLQMVTSTYPIARRQKAQLDILNPHQPSPWTFIGPTNLDNAGSQSGFGPAPVNGRINAVAFEPTDAQTIYLASACGGVWKSIDAGAKWTALTDSQSEIYTSAVATNPQIPNRVYAGTGDYPGLRGNGIGLLVSTNGGVSWTVRGSAQFGETLISDISVDPELSNVLVVASGRGPDQINNLYRTDDEGLSWDNVVTEDANWSDLDISIIEAPFARYLYAAGLRNGSEQVVWRSDDRGSSWTKLTPPVGAANEEIFVACSKVQARTVYLLYPVSRKVYRNTNRGIGTWTDITGDLPAVSGSNWGQGVYNAGLTCFSRLNGTVLTDALMVCNIDLYLSPLANGTWQSIGNAYSGNDKLHVDNHAVGAHPTQANTFVCVNDGGAYGMNFNPSTNAMSFLPLNKNLGTALVSRIAIDSTVQDYVLAGMQDNGMGQSGDIQNWGNLSGGDLGHAAIRPDINGYQYIIPPNLSKDGAGNGHIIRTSDGWATQSNVPISIGADLHRSSPPILINPADTKYVYVGTNYLYRYNEVSQSWSNRLGNQKLSTAQHIRCIGMGASNPNRIYTGSKDGELWMTSNGGASWTRIDTGNPGLPVGSIGAISVNPTNSRQILVGFENSVPGAKLYECIDTLANPRVWISREGVNPKQMPNMPINAIARHPASPAKHYYVGNDVGVFGTFDGGKSWFDLGPNGSLPNVEVTDLKVQAPTNLIYAATYGRGVWRRSLPNPVSELVNGKIALNGYNGTPDEELAEIQVWKGGAVVETLMAQLGANGEYAITPTSVGTATLKFKFLTGLRKAVDVSLGATPIENLDVVLLNGDCDGDDVVSIFDYIQLSAAFDTSVGDRFFDIRADLDGDGEVTIFDYIILSNNFDLQGD